MSSGGKIGAYYQCYRQLTAAKEVITAYRKFFPTNTLVLINDAGDEQHRELDKSPYCKYVQATENVGYPGGKLHHEQIIRWMKRFFTYVNLIEEDWFFLLEDDVFVMKTVDEKTLQYDICGINPRNLLPWPSVNMVRERGYHKDAQYLIYGAMGGAIFRTSFFKAMGQRWDEVERDLNRFGELCPQSLTGQNWYYSDVVLSFLAYLYGGTLGMYPEFAELWFQDLPKRLAENQVGCLNQYKFLYNYPIHPHLTTLDTTKYTIVLPVAGTGPNFELFVDQLLPRYHKYLDPSEVGSFVVVCPGAHLETVRSKFGETTGLPFTFVAEESLVSLRVDDWIRRQIMKLSICSQIQTEYYLTLEEDMIPTQPLRFADFFDEKGRIRYSRETTPGGINANFHQSWWITTLAFNKVGNPLELVKSTNLPGLAPQLFTTRIVHQMLHSLELNWMMGMVVFRAPAHCLYWIYLLKTLRTHYHIISDKLFAISAEVNVMEANLTAQQFKEKLQRGLKEKQHTFLQVQREFGYPKAWITSALADV
jgi:hypothetical protein